jgi:SAM-dependent methyltransferase
MPLDVKRSWDACARAFDHFNSTSDSYSQIIERPAIQEVIGNVSRARVLDLGCGAGPYSILFAEQGARVTGLDLSETMISLAQRKAEERGLQIDLKAADIREPLPYGDAEFDFVFTATALHYVEDLASLFGEIARVLKPSGRFVASVLHPMSTAYFPPANGGDQGQPVYFGQPSRSIETPWLDYGEVPDEGRRIVCHHHSVAEYFEAIAASGLRLTDLREPEPPADYASQNEARYEQAMRVPVYLILKAEHRQAG